jgi:hypothetical protein
MSKEEKSSEYVMCPLTRSCSLYKKWYSELPRENRSFHNIISIENGEHSCNAIEPYFKPQKEITKDFLDSYFKAPECALIKSLNNQNLILKGVEKLNKKFGMRFF